MSDPRSSLCESLRECVGDAYWITLNPGSGNTHAANRLYERLVALVEMTRPLSCDEERELVAE